MMIEIIKLLNHTAFYFFFIFCGIEILRVLFDKEQTVKETFQRVSKITLKYAVVYIAFILLLKSFVMLSPIFLMEVR